MEGIWKTLAAPIIAAVVGGIVVGVVLGRLQSPELPSLTAQSRWINIANPYHSTSRKVQDDIVKLAQSIWGSTEIESLISETRFHNQVRLVSVEFHNNSKVRSKEIEVSSQEGGVFYSPHTAADWKQFSSRVRLRPLDPGGSAKVFAILSPLVVYGSPHVLALHEGKQIDISHREVPDEVAWLFDIVIAYPFLSFFVAMLMAVGGIIVCVLLPVALATEYYPDLKVKLLSKKEIGKQIAFLAYVRERYPDKYAEAEKK